MEKSLHCPLFSLSVTDQEKHHQSSACAFPEFLSFCHHWKLRKRKASPVHAGRATSWVWCPCQHQEPTQSAPNRNNCPGVNKLHPVRSHVSQALQNVLNKCTLSLPLKLNCISFLHGLIVFWPFYLRASQRHAWTSSPSSSALFPCQSEKYFQVLSCH